jgi:hypothetical protein
VNLGTQVMNGVSAQGTWAAMTILAARFGNEQLIVIVSDKRSAPDSQVVVASKTQRFSLWRGQLQSHHHNPSEPDPSLLRVPLDTR